MHLKLLIWRVIIFGVVFVQPIFSILFCKKNWRFQSLPFFVNNNISLAQYRLTINNIQDYYSLNSRAFWFAAKFSCFNGIHDSPETSLQLNKKSSPPFHMSPPFLSTTYNIAQQCQLLYRNGEQKKMIKISTLSNFFTNVKNHLSVVYS